MVSQQEANISWQLQHDAGTTSQGVGCHGDTYWSWISAPGSHWITAGCVDYQMSGLKVPWTWVLQLWMKPPPSSHGMLNFMRPQRFASVALAHLQPSARSAFCLLLLIPFEVSFRL